MNIEVGDKVKIKWGFRNIEGRFIGVGSIPEYLQNKIGTVYGKTNKNLNIRFDEYPKYDKNNAWCWDYNWVEHISEEDEFRKLLIES